jgi:hypothetical protein
VEHGLDSNTKVGQCSQPPTAARTAASSVRA